ncbi:hypothetical protein AAFF_G00179090 [Aldrovandia affinis]|uniref:Uncharacterized protein n=1 Tax=Aldrovandia affinis TaxID=143900 RepID=A0AAD7W6U6_9TELE|nr:hypothetical protein AAFF_G00179090 [Aldrovandia affinis]
MVRSRPSARTAITKSRRRYGCSVWAPPPSSSLLRIASGQPETTIGRRQTVCDISSGVYVAFALTFGSSVLLRSDELLLVREIDSSASPQSAMRGALYINFMAAQTG